MSLITDGERMMIERFRKRPVEVETMLWDGTESAAEAITEWCGLTAFQWYVDRGSRFAQLWIEHQQDWMPLPVGHRVVREADGRGFYPISPEAVAQTYEPVAEDGSAPPTTASGTQEPGDAPPVPESTPDRQATAEGAR